MRIQREEITLFSLMQGRLHREQYISASRIFIFRQRKDILDNKTKTY